MIRSWPLLGLVVLFLCGAVRAADDDELVVEVRVTAVTVGEVFVDQGRSGGLRVGDQVRFLPLGQAVVVGTVRAVARTTARVEVPAVGGLEVGTVGRVRVPPGRLAGEAPAAGSQDEPDDGGPTPDPATDAEVEPPEHPPWEHPPVTWDESVPLLAPVAAIEPEDRRSRISGRAFTDFLGTRDDGPADQRFAIGRAGVDVLWENPFGRGGALAFDGEVSHRHTDVESGSEDETFARLDRLSYSWGHEAGSARAFEVGRFLQREFPEFGVLDGIEFGQRLENGDRVGASFGFLPEPTKTMETGDDLQAAAFYRFVSGPEERFTLGTGFQKTWHEGHPDRDLAVVSTLARPLERLTLYGSAWVDFYGDGDDAKPDPVELTQLQLSGTYTTEGGHGAGLFASHFRWPDIERDEFASLTPEQIRRNRIDRVGVNAWARLTDEVRLSGRLDHWRDQDDEGYSGEVRADLRNLLWDRGAVGLSVFEIEGAFTSGLGGRVMANRSFDVGTLTASWDATSYEQDGFVGSQETLLHQAVRTGWDTSLASGWDLSVFFERRFGDQQDSWTVGLFVQRRF